jgi:hypothetical protein
MREMLYGFRYALSSEVHERLITALHAARAASV